MVVGVEQSTVHLHRKGTGIRCTKVYRVVISTCNWKPCRMIDYKMPRGRVIRPAPGPICIRPCRGHTRLFVLYGILLWKLARNCFLFAFTYRNCYEASTGNLTYTSWSRTATEKWMRSAINFHCIVLCAV